MTAAKNLSENDLVEFMCRALDYYLRCREEAYKRRRLEHSDITAQALKDAGATRATGGLANTKIVTMLKKAGVVEIINEPSVEYIREHTGAAYSFAKRHQDKNPDVLFK